MFIAYLVGEVVRVLFKPLGSDSLITSGGLTFKVKE